MANTPETLQRGEPATLQGGQLGLFGVIMPGLAQVAPAFGLFFTTCVMVALAGASAPPRRPGISWPAGAWSRPWSR